MSENDQNTTKIYWNRKMIEKFIELYRVNACLYDKQSHLYCNQTVRSYALEDMTKKMQMKFFPSLKLEDIKEKIETINSQFSSELSNVKKAKYFGETYVPNLWCYEQLKFLENHVKCSDDCDENPIDEEDNDLDEDSVDSLLKSTQFQTKYRWDRKHTIIFIELYKKYNLLFNRDHKNYTNRKLRHKACIKLLKEIKMVDPSITLTIVREKMRTLRTQYTAEIGRIKKAKENKQPRGPRLWCFKELDNLYNGVSISDNKNTSNSDLIETDENLHGENDECLEERSTWKHEHIEIFINLLKNYTILYDPKCKGHSKIRRSLRKEAWMKLLNETKKIDSSITLKDIREQITNLRDQYKNEIIRSRNVQQKNEKCVSRLWCFELLDDIFNKNVNDFEDMTDDSITTMEVSDDRDPETMNAEIIEFERVVDGENGVDEYEELITVPTMEIVKDEYLPDTIDYDSSNIDYDSEEIKSETEQNDQYDSQESIRECSKKDEESQKYNWLGELVVSQMGDISEKLRSECAWDVQCLIRKYILQSKEDENTFDKS